MLKFTKLLAASAAVALFAIPAQAQEAEEPRTTYRVTVIDLEDGADDRWFEIHETYVAPARAATGQSAETVHWVMTNPDVDLIVVSEMHGGMAAFDSHANPHRDAFFAAVRERAGSDDAMEALGEEIDGLVKSATTYFTHTHP
ncbi:hypothetical protein [Erythrobacter alti]|uniref:hypothetical protein n=1 Tax=Erythrobacter alti TaxID=1896145 RepID=UPI0030F47DD2